MVNSNGAILWEGDSTIDGKPIVLIATGLEKSSRNTKTGAMIQTWILRSDLNPQEANVTGEDRSICGDCPHRGTVENGRNVGRSCYVLMFAPISIYKAYVGGRYAFGDHTSLAGLTIRLGSYGDPAAIPYEVWESLLKDSNRGSGYTHQWQSCDPRFRKYLMASVDTIAESETAQSAGWRTFRIGNTKQAGEFLCPASAEAGKKLDCATCRACSGLSAPNRANVYIPAHGMPSKVKTIQERAET